MKCACVKSYPDRQQLIEFGRKHCAVDRPALIIERIAEAMTEALANNQHRTDGELFSGMQTEWDAGRLMALNDSITMLRRSSGSRWKRCINGI